MERFIKETGKIEVRKENMMFVLSKLLSIVLHPLWMPFYAIGLVFRYTYLSYAGISFKFQLMTVVLAFTVVIPLILILVMRMMKTISSFSLRERKDRPTLYWFVSLCYVAMIMVMYKINTPRWIIFLMGGATVALLVTMLVTLRWKISAHATGIGGLIGGTMIVMRLYQLLPSYELMLLIVLAGMLGSARLYLKAHTPAQVYAGFLNGFVCVYFSLIIDKITL